MDLVDYIYDECHRQHVTNYGDFARARNFAAYLGVTPDDAAKFGLFVKYIAKYVEPDVNTFRPGEVFDNLRTSHVGFMHGGSAAPAGEVRERFDRWCEIAYAVVILTGDTYDEYHDEVDQLIKMLLEIHPWADGNGRTASILRNWMLGTLDDPTPLPEYKF